jgi:DNA topoisomerase-1
VPKNLVIVESPAKARTIERYLGPDYRVLASYGHVRDLPENPGKGKFGVDVDHDFAPEYVISDDRRRQVNDIEKAARGSDMVYLATDLDREGEAIAWHVAEAAHVPTDKTRRVTFSEITEPAIREAFANPRDIDQNLVDAQQTRRIVDRLVGYTLSPLLSRKVRGGLSAGRVQSVAVRLVVEREREIEGFVAREYWTIEALLETAAGERFTAELVRIDGEALDVADVATATRHVEVLAQRHPVVRKIGTRT